MRSIDRAHTNSYWRSVVNMALSRVVSGVFDVEKCRDLEIRVRGHSRSSQPTYRSATYDFLLTFHSNHWHIWHRFRDRRRFQSKIANFPDPRVFCTPVKGFLLELGIGAWGSKRLEWCGYRAEQEIWRYLQPCGYNTPMWRTDGQTDTGRLQRPR